MIGWAIGGLIFGILGDRIGRAKTMLLTILLYSAFTGLSAFSMGFWDFAFYRFLTGLGVGGEFAVGVSLVAEVMPDRARPFALGWLQALSAVGNMLAAVISIGAGPARGDRARSTAPGGRCSSSASLPALLVIPIFLRLKEPEQWKAAAPRGASASGERQAEARLARRALRRPALAAEHDRRHAPGLRGRGRPLGHRLLQLRPDPTRLPQALPRRQGLSAPARSSAAS